MIVTLEAYDLRIGVDDEQGSRSAFWAFWTSLPGILTGGAAVLTAVVALGGFWRASEKDTGGRTRTVTVMQTLAAPESNQPAAKRKTATTPRAAVVAPKPSNVLRRGQVTLENEDNFDFETGRVGHGYEHDILLGGIDPDLGILTTVRTAMAVSAGPNTKAGCVKALSRPRDRISHPQLPGGALVCITTEEGNVAALRIIRPVVVGHPRLTFAYTLWR